MGLFAARRGTGKARKIILVAFILLSSGLCHVMASDLRVKIPLVNLSIAPGGETSIGEISLSSRPISLRVFPNSSCIIVPTDKLQLQVKALLANGTEIDVTDSPYTIYSSSDSEAVSVSTAGLVSVTGIGKGAIRAEYLLAVGYAEILADPSVSVLEVRPLFGVERLDEMLPEETAPAIVGVLAPHNQAQISVLATLSNGETCHVTGNKSTVYTSSNQQIAGVDDLGRVTADVLGATQINVQTTGISTSAIVYVQLKDEVAPITDIYISTPVYISSSGSVYISTHTSVYLDPYDPVVESAYSSGITFTGVAIDVLPSTFTAFWRYIPFTIMEGQHTLYYASRDNAGNTEVIKSTVVYVDGTAPGTGFEITGSSYTDGEGNLVLSPTAHIDFTGQDAGSGPGMVYYSVDAAEYSIFAGTFTLSVGTHTVSYYGIDNVGNAEAPHSVALTVRAPVTAIWSGLGLDGNWHNPANWRDNAVPGPGDGAIVATRETVVVDSTALRVRDVILGDEEGLSAPILLISTAVDSSGEWTINRNATLTQGTTAQLALGTLTLRPGAAAHSAARVAAAG